MLDEDGQAPEEGIKEWYTYWYRLLTGGGEGLVLVLLWSSENKNIRKRDGDRES